MRNALALLALFTLTLGTAMTVSATEDAPDATAADCATTLAGPPCGWINPQLYLDLPSNVPCGSSVLGETSDGEGCLAPPTAGSTLTMDGEFILTWEVSEEGTYLNDPNDPIEVTFRPTGNNPSFIDFSVEPSSFTLDTATLFNPTYYVTKESSGGNDAVWYEYRAPVSVTFTRNGDPSAEDIERIQNRGGEIPILIRIHSDPSGSTFKDSYGLEAIYFHVGAADDSDVPLQSIDGLSGQEAPLPSMAFVGIGLLGAAVAVRSRQD